MVDKIDEENKEFQHWWRYTRYQAQSSLELLAKAKQGYGTVKTEV